MTHNAYKCNFFFSKQNNIYSVITEDHENNVISKEHQYLEGAEFPGHVLMSVTVRVRVTAHLHKPDVL